MECSNFIDLYTCPAFPTQPVKETVFFPLYGPSFFVK